MAKTLDATSVKSWFRLDRFDEDATPTEEATEPESETTEEGEGDKPAEPAKPKPTDTVDYWKRKSRENEKQAKANADKAKRLDELEAANKTEAEKLTAAKEAAEKRAVAATARAVTSEVRALADEFADREDAVLNLGDLTKYVDAGGDIDTEAIRQDLADVLDRKKHLRKAPAEAPKPPKPKPDPGQGKTGDDKPTDFRTADDATFKSELARMGIRPRS